MSFWPSDFQIFGKNFKNLSAKNYFTFKLGTVPLKASDRFENWNLGLQGKVGMFLPRVEITMVKTGKEKSGVAKMAKT